VIPMGVDLLAPPGIWWVYMHGEVAVRVPSKWSTLLAGLATWAFWQVSLLSSSPTGRPVGYVAWIVLVLGILVHLEFPT
jgi:hypothetical protein